MFESQGWNTLQKFYDAAVNDLDAQLSLAMSKHSTQSGFDVARPVPNLVHQICAG
jgi:hypothetical protein